MHSELDITPELCPRCGQPMQLAEAKNSLGYVVYRHYICGCTLGLFHLTKHAGDSTKESA